MLKAKVKSAICSFILIASGGSIAQGSDRFIIPEDELMREVVLPRFDRREMVRNQNIKFKDRFEFAAIWGSNFTEPVYSPMKFGVEMGYHWSDDHAAHFSYSQWGSGFNTQYVPGIEDQGNVAGSAGDYDFSRVPVPKSSIWGFYTLKSYYGKMSLSKKNTMNLSTYTQYGLGFTQFSHKTYPGVAVGVGQKFYFSNSFGIKAELRLQYQGQPNPFLGDGKLKNNSPVPQYSEFSDIYRFGTIFELGALWMF